jgi:hypothetical protein
MDDLPVADENSDVLENSPQAEKSGDGPFNHGTGRKSVV